jgi:predicted Zn-dependent peptidase
MSAPPVPPAPGNDAAAFIGAAEAFAARAFRYRDDMTFLLEACRARHQQQLFDDLVFYAKFITNALQILRRVGADNADAVKLSAELRDMLEKTTTLLRTIVKEEPGERRQRFLDTFLALSQPSMAELTALCAELAWVKNYMLDQRAPR